MHRVTPPANLTSELRLAKQNDGEEIADDAHGDRDGRDHAIRDKSGPCHLLLLPVILSGTQGDTSTWRREKRAVMEVWERLQMVHFFQPT